MPQQHEKQGLGNGGYCLCPKCQTKHAHQSGQPCQSAQCPECGAKLLREGSEHHQKWAKRNL